MFDATFKIGEGHTVLFKSLKVYEHNQVDVSNPDIIPTEAIKFINFIGSYLTKRLKISDFGSMRYIASAKRYDICLW